MLWPINPAHNPVKLNVWQRIMVPKAGKPFVFTRKPGGSYSSEGEIYTCSGFPNTADPWSSKDVSLHNVAKGSGCFDRLSAWEHAEWHYVD